MEYSKKWITVTREKLLSDLEKMIKPKRFKHVLRVEETAIELASLYDLDTEKASISALMHDYAKDMENGEMLQLAMRQWEYPDLTQANDNVWHGFAAAAIAKEKYGVEDQDILNAISAHTIGWYDMTPLMSVVYIADYIEPGRDFPGVTQARKLASKNLDAAVGYKMAETIKYIIEERKEVFLPTVEFYNHWIVRSKDK